jgi:hypothetical protein
VTPFPGLLAQADTTAADPDLTVPILVISVCVVLIVVTLVIQRVRSRRRHRVGTRAEIEAWQLEGGRLLDQWINEVEAEVQARRSSPYPETVTRNDDPPGLEQGIKDCPDARLGALIEELRAAGAQLLNEVREHDPNGPQAAVAEAHFQSVKGQAAGLLQPAGPPPAPL